MFSVSPAEFQELASGRRRGMRAALLRAACAAAAIPYGFAVRWRNWCYDRRPALAEHVDVPVVCVGNLTTGGTGKTPMVLWLARWFRQRGVRVCIVSRGYGATADAANDEALELELRLPDVPHLQNADRVAAARTAIEEFESQLILLDDGFQHRRLRRDLDIVLLDATEPFGFGKLLPRGLLREPVSSLRRAGAVVLTRADAADAAWRDAIRREVRRHAPHAIWAEAVHLPTGFVSASSSAGEGRLPLEALRGKPVLAFCGIGNPRAFRATLEALGAQVAQFQEFPDHHAYRREDLTELAGKARQCGAAALVCTHKDLVKIRTSDLEGVALWALEIEMTFRAGQEELEAAMKKFVATPAAQ